MTGFRGFKHMINAFFCVTVCFSLILITISYIRGGYIQPISQRVICIGRNKIKIGILIPSTTQQIENPVLDKLSLTKFCLPSVADTMDPTYEYTVYIGIDRGDYLESVKQEIVKQFCFVKPVIVRGGTFTDTVNEIARIAYSDDMNYLVRINDDTKFISNNWTSIAIETLLNFHPPNVGVVGPTCNYGNKNILTHDMVHRTHLDIFDYYYPPVFENFWADDWITAIYKPNRCSKLASWEVQHKRIHGRRYIVNRKKLKRLENIERQDKKLVDKYICSKSTKCMKY